VRPGMARVRSRSNGGVTKSRERRTAAGRPAVQTVAGVTITHPERVVAAAGDVTKLEVARYHADVAAWLMPQVAKRPLAVVKCPGGDLAGCFFQRHPGRPGGAEPSTATPPWMAAPTLADVVALVQDGVFEFHTWAASFPTLDRPDRIILDLDPDPALGWAQVRDGCAAVRALLDRLDLAWFLKTTGGKGLHFVVPLARRHTFDDVKDFARALAFNLAAAQPALFTATAKKTERSGRIYVDYLRNATGATAVAAYSLRARAKLPVSMPIEWADLAVDVRDAHFNLRNAPAHIAARARDPWAGYAAARTVLSATRRRALAA